MSKPLKLHLIPESLQSRNQWIVWKLESRGGKPTKVPYQVDGVHAKSDSPETWTDFDSVRTMSNGYSGVGYVFAQTDPYVGIDLDGCRNPETGKVAEWARAIILRSNSYAEVSPSETGIKIWVEGSIPFSGKKVALKNVPTVCEKEPAIELYTERRYFAMTGWRVTGPSEPQQNQEALDWLCSTYFADVVTTPAEQDWHSDQAVIERARKYIAKLPPAVSGQNGSGACFHAACVLVLGFSLGEGDATMLLREYSERCNPPWSEKELQHKIRSAMKQNGQRGYLRNAKPERWTAINVPEYREPPRPPEQTQPAKNQPRETDIVGAMRAYVDTIRYGQTSLIETGIQELDFKLGGGFEKGELILFGARPSHGKSAVALQCVHYWTSHGLPCAFVSEEMSAIALGKRSLQFISDIPQQHWSDLTEHLDAQVEGYASTHAKCIVLEGCGDAMTTVDAIERVIERDKVECVVVDYAQLLRGSGKTRYEQMTSVSITLRQLASKHKIIVLALCQLSREIEKRDQFRPTMSDLKESGQFEQDADVAVFLVWPWRLNDSEPPNRYQFFIEKNRNRGIEHGKGVDCLFDPARQKIMMQAIET